MNFHFFSRASPDSPTVFTQRREVSPGRPGQGGVKIGEGDSMVYCSLLMRPGFIPVSVLRTLHPQTLRVTWTQIPEHYKVMVVNSLQQ